MLLNDIHKKELLEIAENYPVNIALLVDYLENKLDLLPSDLENEDKDAFQNSMIKSYANTISNLRSKKEFEKINILLEGLKEWFNVFFGEELNFDKVYNYKALQNGNTNPKEKNTLEMLNSLLNKAVEIHGNSLLETSSDFEIILPIFKNNKPLYLKVFSIGDKSIFDNFQFFSAIIYLTDKLNQNGKANYDIGFTVCINDGDITYQAKLPLSGESSFVGG